MSGKDPRDRSAPQKRSTKRRSVDEHQISIPTQRVKPHSPHAPTGKRGVTPDPRQQVPTPSINVHHHGRAKSNLKRRNGDAASGLSGTDLPRITGDRSQEKASINKYTLAKYMGIDNSLKRMAEIDPVGYQSNYGDPKLLEHRMNLPYLKILSQLDKGGTVTKVLPARIQPTKNLEADVKGDGNGGVAQSLKATKKKGNVEEKAGRHNYEETRDGAIKDTKAIRGKSVNVHGPLEGEKEGNAQRKSRQKKTLAFGLTQGQTSDTSLPSIVRRRRSVPKNDDKDLEEGHPSVDSTKQPTQPADRLPRINNIAPPGREPSATDVNVSEQNIRTMMPLMLASIGKQPNIKKANPSATAIGWLGKAAKLTGAILKVAGFPDLAEAFLTGSEVSETVANAIRDSGTDQRIEITDADRRQGRGILKLYLTPQQLKKVTPQQLENVVRILREDARERIAGRSPSPP